MKNRIHGYDLARALAIVGMVFVHLASYSFPGAALASGYSSALFAVLAGVSTSLMMASGNAAGGAELGIARHRLLVRGVLIMALGIALSSVQSGVVVVLQSIAWILLALGPVTRWRTARVWALLAGLVVVGPAVAAAASFVGFSGPELAGAYPLLAWLAYGTAGILIHRLLTHNLVAQAVAVVVGFAAAAASYPLRYGGWEPGAGPSLVQQGDFAPQEPSLGIFLLSYGSWEPHSGGVIDVLCSLLFATAIISACLLLCRAAIVCKAAYPLRAMGSMALSVYVAHALTAGWLVGGFVPALPVGEETDSAAGPEHEMPWSVYQDKVAGAADYDEYYAADAKWWDRYYAEQAELAPGEEEALPAAGHNLAFWLTLALGSAGAMAWRMRFRRGPMETAVNRTIDAAVRPGDFR